MMQPHAIITPLKAIRMLLNGTGVLVRAEKWAEIQSHMQECKRRQWPAGGREDDQG